MAVKETKSARARVATQTRAKKSSETSTQKQLKIRLIRSLIGRPKKQREVVKGLGLRRINSEVLRRDCPEIWGMIKKIQHLLEVEALEKK